MELYHILTEVQKVFSLHLGIIPANADAVITIKMENSLYVHVPFCVKKCSYCDFLSFNCGSDFHEKYFIYLQKELNLYQKQKYSTIYIGGGTPSSVSHHLIKYLLSNVSFDSKSEITIEANPGTLTKETLAAYRDYGINRLSMGCQSFDDNILKLLGRIHSSSDIFSSYSNARAAGFTNINLDLIFSVPCQSFDVLKNDLEKIVSLSPEHISIYSLIWEENTPFHDMLKKGLYQTSDESLENDMYTFIIDFLRANGYNHYEISNFSKPGYESKHNNVYWQNKNYTGIGLGASGYINHTRYKNFDSFDKYFSSLDNNELPIFEKDILNPKDIIEYEFILGLRLLNKGINLKKIEKKYDYCEEYVKIAENLIETGFLEYKKGNVVLSSKAIPVSNEIFMKFLI